MRCGTLTAAMAAGEGTPRRLARQPAKGKIGKTIRRGGAAARRAHAAGSPALEKIVASSGRTDAKSREGAARRAGSAAGAAMLPSAVSRRPANDTF